MYDPGFSGIWGDWGFPEEIKAKMLPTYEETDDRVLHSGPNIWVRLPRHIFVLQFGV